ncbi:alpha/beta fold hydrolase [Allosphingosinicella vermicomposti]|uniref:alpha/beta fold hydrolase n=1 Tax=Allosphingosinicella vermicomposti TaxID=614671 RepID=UPI001FDF25FF|nr:alpha/beta fold hydrolase [Allosphingosinicella vermicomposti]
MSLSSASRMLLASAAILIAAAPFSTLSAQPTTEAGTAFRQMDHISVEMLGSEGPPVIFIPGLSSPRDAWHGVAPDLARTHRVYLVQVNGFGGDDPRSNLRSGILGGIVDDMRRLIQDQRLDSPAIVGHSMGGLVGLMSRVAPAPGTSALPNSP